MFDGKFFSVKTISVKTEKFPLGKILQKSNEIDTSFYIKKNKKVKYQKIEQIDREAIEIKTEWDKWKYLKGRKSQWKINKSSGYRYKYGEGKMNFPDSKDEPSRTIITGEGDQAHQDLNMLLKKKKVYLEDCPVELDKLNMFPEDHTTHELVTDTKRAFFMGNALVIGIVEKIGIQFQKKIDA